MSILSQKRKGNNSTYLKLILYEAHLLQDIKKIKNIFPYFISIQFNNDSEKLISPIKNINEIFNISKTIYKYFIRKKDKKIIININCFSNTSFKMKKRFASCIIEIENINNLNNNGKNSKKWYFLKNKNPENIVKLLMSIDLVNKNEKDTNNLYFNENEFYLKTETDLDKNIIINKPESINIHINSITKNNLNIITNNIYKSNFNNFSFINDCLKNVKNNTMLRKNCNTHNLFSNLLMKNKKDNKTNNLYFLIEKIIEKINERFSPKFKNLNNQKHILEIKNNDYFQKKDELIKRNNDYQNELKKYSKDKQIYENQYLDININYNELKNKIYRDEIIKDINNYEKEVIFNINYIIQNNLNIYEMHFNKKLLSKEIEFKPSKIEKGNNSKDIEISNTNNYFNNQRYSFESNGKTNSSIYLFQKNYKKTSFNNKDIYNTKNNLYNDNDSNIGNVSSISNLILKNKKKEDNINIAKSESNSPNSDKYGKNRLITDYSKSSFIINDLYINDELKPKKTIKYKQLKKNILNINKILNIKNKNYKLIKNKTSNNIDMNNNKKLNSNLSHEKIKGKELDLIDDNTYNLYYNIESKKKENKYKVLNNNKLKGTIFKQKMDNNFIKGDKKINNKKPMNVLNYHKSYNIFSIENINTTKNGIKTNQVFKNVLKLKNNNKNYLMNSSKITKKEKIKSNITLNTESSLFNNSTLGRVSLMSFNKGFSENTNSRNFKLIQHCGTTNQNNNHLKSIIKPKINEIKKEINTNKKNLGKKINNMINNNKNSKEIIKKAIQLNKNGMKYSKLKKICNFPKINKSNEIKIFQNKFINKKDKSKLINNSKRLNKVLTNKKTFNNFNDNNIDKKNHFYVGNKNRTINPFERYNKIKKKIIIE